MIRVEDLGKQYLLTHKTWKHTTLVDTMCQWFKRSPPSQISETFWALNDLSFDVEEGDRLGIIGRNGAGKSTLLKILSCITEPSCGRVRIRGKVASLLEVGVGFHPELSGRENIFLNGAILGMSRQEIRKKFDAIVAFAEVEKFLDTPVKRFSSGMYTRLGFAVAAHLDPDILIVDEVLAVGDTFFQGKCLQKLSDLAKQGKTVLFVSHDTGNILSVCNKGLWLDKGEKRGFGPMEEVVGLYLKSLKTRPLFWRGEVGDEHIRFSRFALCLERGSDRDFFYQHETPELRLEYEVFKSDPDLIFGFSVLNQRNQIVARSHIADNTATMGKFTTPGLHKVSFALPCHLFNEGEYAIRLECVIHNKKSIICDELFLKFPIFATQKNVRYPHLASLGGVYLGGGWQEDE